MPDWGVIIKSLLAFYDKVSREDGFDKRIPPCWIRQWLDRMNTRWFSAKSILTVPYKKRAEYLKSIFEDGFGTYNQIMKYGSFMQRLAAFHVRMFVKYPALKWYVDFYFLCAFSPHEFYVLFRRVIKKFVKYRFHLRKTNNLPQT